MEVKPGLKRTEVNEILKDWSSKPLYLLTTEIGDGIHATPTYSPSGNYYFINGNNLHEGQITITEETKAVSYSEFTKYQKALNARSILMSINGTIGNLAMYAGEAVILGKSAAYLNVNQNNSKNFVFYALQTEQVRRQFFDGLTGSTIKNLGLETLRNIQIFHPTTLTEQEAIAETLSDADALVEALEQLITKKRLIKQGVIQELLRPKDGWIQTFLGNVASFYKGKGLAKNELDTYGKEPCIHYGELFLKYPETINQIYSHTNTITETFRSLANDILMPTSDVTPNGLATASCLLEDQVIIGGDILVIRAPRNKLNGSFLSYMIRKSRSQIMQLVTGTTVYHLYGSDMKRFTFSMPRIEDQEAIVETLDDMNTEISALVEKLVKVRLIKQGMMQELLTGRIRLI
jgi:type I restriction enzyme S subunit